MTNFQSQLESELERRGLKKKPVEKTKPEKNKKVKIKKEKIKKNKRSRKPLPFSFSTFLIALLLGLTLLFAFIVFLWIKADKTAEKLQSRLPTKTAIVNKEVDIDITTEDVQPILRMKPAIDPKEEIETSEVNDITPETQDQIAPLHTALPPAPIPGLFETSDYGQLPIINKEDGSTAFNAYKKPFNKIEGKPSIAFIVSNLGLNDKQTEKIISELPENISLSFSPYAWNVKSFMMSAREKNHETWLTLPLQTKDFPLQDSGPLSILLDAPVQQNDLRLKTLLGKAVGYAGVITEKNHVFRREDARNNQSFKEIFERGLAIIDSNDKSINFVEDLAKQKGYPHAQNNFWLDDDLRPLALNQKLRQALELSRNSGSAIIMLHPYPASIDTLNKFLNSVAAQEFNIVPASALVKNDE